MKNKCAPVHLLPTPTLPTPTSKTTVTPSNNNYTDTSGASLAYLAYAESIRYLITLHPLRWITDRIPTEIHFIGSLRLLHPTHTKHHPTHTTQPPTHWLTYGTNHALASLRQPQTFASPRGVIERGLTVCASGPTTCLQFVPQRLLGMVWTYGRHKVTGYLPNRRAAATNTCRIDSARNYIARCFYAPFLPPSMLGFCTGFTATCTLRGA